MPWIRPWYRWFRVPTKPPQKKYVVGPLSPGGRGPTQLAFEQLEDRVQPVTNVFTNPAGGSWHVASNWSLSHAPAAGEDVEIPDLPGNQTVTFSTGTSPINSLSASENLTLSGGTLSVATTAQVSGGVLTLSGGILSRAAVSVTAPLKITAAGGTLDGVTLNGAWT